MNDKDFDAAATRALQRMEHALEGCGADFDIESKEGGILELEFDDGSKIIINRHGAAKEIWIAARSGGFHFRWDGAQWRDTRDGTELFAKLAALVSAQLGRPVRLD